MVQSMLAHECVYSEADCCGNGCANCVLNIRQTKNVQSRANAKRNILDNYTKFKLIGKSKHINVLSNVLELHFAYMDKASTADVVLYVPAGYHVMMRAPNLQAENVENNYLLRPYSPYWVDELNFEFKILVNLKPQGAMSNYIEHLQLNDEVYFRGPIGSLTHPVNDNHEHNTLIIVTQGVAIAPALRIIEEILNNEEDMRRILHLACFSDFQHFYFRDKLLEFQHYWNYKNRIYLAHEVCQRAKCIEAACCAAHCESFEKQLYYKEHVLAQRIDKHELEEVCLQLKNTNHVQLVIAGTRMFQDYVANAAKEVEVNIQSINIHLL